ncbi:MAG: VacJ family lipoprotein, partial [Gammaproteobacteria bacterium]|nr:VacJ family lipoprotein [Gammaproteobacteria bacterium]
LQFKFKQFLQDLTRFIFNTFFGLFGLFDVATHMGLPKHEEDFGQTLATWGVGDGPYFVLPLLGPSTLRDTAGLAVDWQYDPVNEIKDDQARYATIGLKAINKRAGLLKASNIVEQASFDKYAFTRDAYLQHRKNLIHDGNPPREKPANLKSSKEDEALEDELEAELLKSP